VTLTHRNVCRDGFTVEGRADAVFLDLPAPWDAVEHAKRALRKDKTTRICCFSPCIEQVLRTVNALNDVGFVEITMYETLQRPHDVSQIPSLPSVKDAANKLKQMEQRREEKRLRQIAQNKAKLTTATTSGFKRKRDGDTSTTPEVDPFPIMTSEESAAIEEYGHDGAAGSSKKCKRTDIPGEDDVAMSDQIRDHATKLPIDSLHQISSGSAPPARISVSKVFPEVRGHTSYLTFASLLPSPATGSPLNAPDPVVDNDL